MGVARAEAEAARAQAEMVSAGLKQHLDVLLADVKQRQAHAADQADADASLARQVKQVLAVLDTQRHELAVRLSEAEQERATQAAELQQRLDEAQSELHRQQSEAERLRQVAAIEIARAAGLINETGASTVRGRLPLMWRAARLKRSGLFDAEWYLRQNADVADSGIDPLRHYIQFGAKEGRAPNPGLVTPNGKS
jgi:chromosome segregation ATPase